MVNQNDSRLGVDQLRSRALHDPRCRKHLRQAPGHVFWAAFWSCLREEIGVKTSKEMWKTGEIPGKWSKMVDVPHRTLSLPEGYQLDYDEHITQIGGFLKWGYQYPKLL